MRLLAESKQETPVTRTLYIRHVPDDVAERLERLASRAGSPLSTFALQELSETARRTSRPVRFSRPCTRYALLG